MPKRSNTEIVSLGPGMQSKTGADVETIRALAVQIAQLLADKDGAVIEPFFRSRQVAYEIRRLQNVPEQKLASERYKRLGCMICHKSDHPHGGNGFCCSCYSRELHLRKQILKDLIQEKERR
jgi:hypothetical protein